MPWSKNSELPREVKSNLPSDAQTLFRKAFNKAFARGNSEATSMQIAWSIVKKKFKKVDGEWVAQGMGSAKFFRFEMSQSEGEFIKQSSDGEEYIEFTLADINPNIEGKRFSPDFLKKMSEQINTYGLPAFFGHDNWDNFVKDNMHLERSEFIQQARENRKSSIFKKVKSIFEDGKLFVKAFIDKRYRNHIKKYQKVSLESFVPREHQVGNVYEDGYVLGVALTNSPRHPGAKIYKNVE